MQEFSNSIESKFGYKQKCQHYKEFFVLVLFKHYILVSTLAIYMAPGIVYLAKGIWVILQSEATIQTFQVL